MVRRVAFLAVLVLFAAAVFAAASLRTQGTRGVRERFSASPMTTEGLMRANIDARCAVPTGNGTVFTMSAFDGLDTKPGLDTNQCFFKTAAGNGAVMDDGLTRCSASSFVYDPTVVTDLRVGKVWGDDRCVVTFATDKPESAYAAYDRMLKNADVTGSDPYRTLQNLLAVALKAAADAAAEAERARAAAAAADARAAAAKKAPAPVQVAAPVANVDLTPDSRCAGVCGAWSKPGHVNYDAGAGPDAQTWHWTGSMGANSGAPACNCSTDGGSTTQLFPDYTP